MDAYVICTWSSGKVKHRPADQRTESSPPQGSRPTKTERKDKRPGRSYGGKKTCVALHWKVRDGRRGDKNRRTNTQNKENKEQVGGGQKRSWRLIFWILMEESWANQSGRLGLRSLTLVQRSRQCVYAAAVCVRGQRLLRGHGRNVVGRRGLRGRTGHNIWHGREERFTWQSSVGVRVQLWPEAWRKKKKRQRITEMAAAPTWTVFFHQSVLVPFLPVDHFLINKLCGKQEMLSLCTKRTARICGYIRSHKINFFLLKLYNNSCSLVSFFNYDRN